MFWCQVTAILKLHLTEKFLVSLTVHSPAYSIAKKASALNIAVLFELITFLYTVNTVAIACRIYT